MRTSSNLLLLLSAVSIALSAGLFDARVVHAGTDDAGVARKLDGSPRGVRTHGAAPLRSSSGRSTAPPAFEVAPGRDAAEVAAPAAFLPFKLSGGGPVGLFGVTSDGMTAVWIETVGGIAQLFSRPVDGSGPAIHLTAGLFDAGDDGVTGFDFSPDDSTVVFTGDFVLGLGVDSLAGVPIGGGSIVTLNRPSVDEPISEFGVSPDSLLVFYLGRDSLHGSTRVEVHTNGIFGGTPTQLSGAGLSAHGHADVFFAEFTPDSAKVVHAADLFANGTLDLFAGPATAYYDATLSSAKGTVTWAQIGSTRVTYISDDDVLGVQEVYSVRLDGGGKRHLNSTMAGGATDLAVGPDGTRALYRADQDTLGVIEGYTAVIDTAASSTKFHDALSASRDVDSANFTPDGAGVLYRADELETGVTELFVRPLDLSAPSTLLHDAVLGEIVGLIDDRGVPILDRRAVYPLFGATVDLFSVAIDGSEPFVKLNDPLGTAQDLFSAYVPFEQPARLIAYGGGPTSTGTTAKVFATPIRKDLPVEQFNVTAATGDTGVDNYLINATETHGVYAQDQDTQLLLELYSVELDSDGDGTGNAADSCKFHSNPGGASAEFLQTITAPDKATVVWAQRDEVRFAQGALPVDGTYATTSTGSLADSSSFEDPSTPPAGNGTWTLIAPDCAGRGWGNAGRDLVLP